MDFRIADTFTDSLARLSGEEQKAAKTTAFDLQLNPATPGLSFHKLDKVKDKNFWSVRVSSDSRLIVHRVHDSLLLCYVDHHDRAYDWAERRRLETHPKTGAAQWVEIRETVQQIVVPVYVQTELALAPQPATAPKRLFAGRADDELLGYGVPAEWLDDVKQATEATLLALADHLPAEAAEALLELATGGKPRVPAPAVASANPFDHPDAQRHFRVMANVEELQAALDSAGTGEGRFMNAKQLQLAQLVWSLERHTQRATYGAVAGLIGLAARSVMQGQVKGPRNSWVVSSETHLPTGYTEEQRHPLLEAKASVIRSTEKLAAWWEDHRCISD